MSTIDTSNVLLAYNALYGGALSRTPLNATTFSRVAVENTLNSSSVLPQGPFDKASSGITGTLGNIAPIIDAIEENSTLAQTGGPIGVLIDAYYTRETSATDAQTLLGSLINTVG